MGYTYGVVIEKYKGSSDRIAGIANNVTSRNDIPATIASKGKGYSCYEIPYTIRTPLENGGFLVYIIEGRVEDYAGDKRKILPIHKEGAEVTADDFFIYKTEASAMNKVRELNYKLDREKKYEAVCFEFLVNTVY